jgi:hypothetical protein
MIFSRIVLVLLSFLVVTDNSSLHTHGFSADTLLWASGDWKSIQEVCEELTKQSTTYATPSYDITQGWNIPPALFQKRVKNGWVPLKSAARSVTNCSICITLDSQRPEIIKCTPTQEFYVSSAHAWKAALDLEPGDELLTINGYRQTIVDVSLVQSSLEVYSISVGHPHTYFVSVHQVLTHNMALPALTLTASIPWDMALTAAGHLAVELGPLTCGISIALAAGTGIGYAIYQWTKGSTEIPTYKLSFDAAKIHTYLYEKSESNKEEGRAPGKPTEKDGYIPSKRWDGKKVKNPNGYGTGWPDQDGNVWVPTGPHGHRGPHWDVQNPKNGRHENVLPGGKKC